jgi:hypothetical protein
MSCPSDSRCHERNWISGRYLGEILCLVICELIDEGVLFLGQNMYKIESPYVLDTAFLSLMEGDLTEELLMIISIFTHFFALEMTLAKRQFFCALAKLGGGGAPRGKAEHVGHCGNHDQDGLLGRGMLSWGGWVSVQCAFCDFCLSLGRLLSPWREREQSELIVTSTVSHRNTLASWKCSPHQENYTCFDFKHESL